LRREGREEDWSSPAQVKERRSERRRRWLKIMMSGIEGRSSEKLEEVRRLW